MPIKHAAFKAWRKTKKRTARNAKVKADTQYLLRTSRKLLSSAKIKEAKDQIHKTIVALDRAAQNNVLKKNTVSRLKSRLMTAMNKAETKK